MQYWSNLGVCILTSYIWIYHIRIEVSIFVIDIAVITYDQYVSLSLFNRDIIILLYHRYFSLLYIQWSGLRPKRPISSPAGGGTWPLLIALPRGLVLASMIFKFCSPATAGLAVGRWLASCNRSSENCDTLYKYNFSISQTTPWAPWDVSLKLMVIFYRIHPGSIPRASSLDVVSGTIQGGVSHLRIPFGSMGL